MTKQQKKTRFILYFMLVAVSAVGLGLSNNVMSNFFKDAYNVTAYQRGLIEFPRELPGLIAVFIIGSLSFMNDIRISILSQVLGIIGISVLGLTTPSFNVMLIFIFIHSVGMHIFMPMKDAIGVSLAEPNMIGKRMGQFKGVDTGFRMIAALIVFFGFRYGGFSFETNVKLPFIIAAVLFALVVILLLALERSLESDGPHPKKQKFVYRKEYKYYYLLVILFGVQKQIMMVYGPWVLIDLLGKKADTIAILTIIGSGIGIFFIPALGRWLDRFGIKKLMYVDALSFIVVYTLYGFLTASFVSGVLQSMTVAVFLAYAIFIIDKMSTQMSLIRTVYLKSILKDPQDLTPTLSLGMSMDHFVSITCAYIGGIVWMTFGPQYIFFFVAFLSLGNLYVAFKLKDDSGSENGRLKRKAQ